MERDMGDLLSAGNPRLRNKFLPRMDSLVTANSSKTLKQTMEHTSEREGSFCFLIDESEKPVVLTLREIIMQFAPPCMDSSIHDGFFESALEQTGFHIKNGTIICDH